MVLINAGYHIGMQGYFGWVGRDVLNCRAGFGNARRRPNDQSLACVVGVLAAVSTPPAAFDNGHNARISSALSGSVPSVATDGLGMRNTRYIH